MGKIVLLDDITINKIAAGEVVERPVAVVKELVENALDAGASRIDITVTGGGLDSIRVVDDGSGMAPEDVPLSLQRHATSKICAASDLATVLTLGFRGEALPSIAAVSRLRLITRREGDLAGTLVEVHGGRMVRQTEHGCPAGTEIKVDNLFYNTPARLKFVKSEGAETARITDTIGRLALSWPQIAFALEANGREVLTTSGNGILADVLHQVYGRANSRLFLPLQWEGPLLKVRGYISLPSLARANRNMQSFFVNNRYIRSPLISDALQTAYQTLLPRNRFPAAVLFVEINTNEVDVNVHPAKREVRFSGERDVYRQILAAVRQTLKSASLVAELSPPKYSPGTMEQRSTQGIFSPNLFSCDTASQLADRGVSIYSPFPAETCPAVKDSVSFPGLQPLGRYREGYILAQSESNDLYIVDQHAAHERLLYELYKDDVEKGSMPVQQIVPLTVELDALTASSLQSRLKLFARLGLTFEVFGNNTFILRTVPLFYREFLKQEDILELVAAFGKEQDGTTLFAETLKMMACKAAVKANDAMTREEMAALLKNLQSAQNPYTCPHGRPTVLVFTAASVDSHFRRH